MDKDNLQDNLKTLLKDVDAIEQLFSDYYELYIKDEFSEVEPLSESEENNAENIREKLNDAVKRVVNDIVRLVNVLNNNGSYTKEQIQTSNRRLVKFAGHLYNINVLYHALETENLTEELTEIHKVFISNITTFDTALKQYNNNPNHEEKLYDIVIAKKKYDEELRKNESYIGLPEWSMRRDNSVNI